MPILTCDQCRARKVSYVSSLLLSRALWITLLFGEWCLTKLDTGQMHASQ